MKLESDNSYMFCPTAPEHLAERPMANPVSASTDSQTSWETERETEIDRETKAATERAGGKLSLDADESYESRRWKWEYAGWR